MPFVRTAMMTVALTGSRVADGISRTITKSDRGKVKSNKDLAQETEKLLCNSWFLLQKQKIWPMTRRPKSLAGCPSTILDVLKKEKFGEEGAFSSLQDISDVFSKEYDQDNVDARPAPAEDNDPMNAKDLLATGPGEIALLQNKHKLGEKCFGRKLNLS